MKFETKRLILRPPKKSDWKDILDGAKDLEVSRNTLLIPHPYKKKDAVWFINHSIKKWKDKNQKDYPFFIELKSEKKVIGVTEINVKHSKKAGTGSWISKKYWKKGYITEAKIPLIDFVFNKLKLRRLESEAFKDNKASNNMSKKLGYVCEGTKRKSDISKADGKLHDTNVYGLLKEEWKKTRPKLIKEIKKRQYGKR